MKGNTLLLLLVAVMLGCTLYVSYTNFQQIQMLRQENADLWVKIDSVQQICNKKPIKQSAAPAAKPATSGNTLFDYLIRWAEESEREAAREKAKQKVVVSTKYRLEDRYVSGRVQEPEFLGNQTGEVVLNISVATLGDVTSVNVRSVTGITNEDVIEACKKAALRTDFNYNYNHKENRSGTITYTFSAK
ncbi:MAG: hypothetical protein E7116_05415 [Bacteroidales bacterium]|nr:hypothetical protein [Bacteroidales bacterium]